MTALATIADYEMITGQSVADGAPTTRVEGLLELASSALLAGAHGQDITSTTHTNVVLRPFEGVAYFPQRPVTAVASVQVRDAEGNLSTLTANTDYRFEAGGCGRPAKLIRRRYGRDDWFGTATVVLGFDPVSTSEAEVVVTYTAGWDPIPGPIIAATVALVVSTMANGGGQPTTSETAGPFSESYDTAEVQSPSMALTPATQKMLDGYCKAQGASSVPMATGAP